MKIYKIEPKGFGANCYLVTVDGKTAVAIDPSQLGILKRAQSVNLQIKYVLFTHGHFDHIGGAADLQKNGAKIGCFSGEVETALTKNLGLEMMREPVPPFEIDFTFEDGEVLNLCGINFTVLFTPGHTSGSVCFVCEDNLFSGDTLFRGGVGRTDMPTGNARQLQDSLKKLCALDGDYTVFCGHGDITQLNLERKFNPYLEGLC